MRRFAFTVLALVGCHHRAAPSASDDRPCPGVEITRGSCAPQPDASTECHGVCGVVVERGSCRPVRDAVVMVDQVVASTDQTGRFELPALPAGHYRIVVTAGPDRGALELDLTGTPEVLPQSLEMPSVGNRACGCGGPCPT